MKTDIQTELDDIVNSMKLIDYQSEPRFRKTLNHEIKKYSEYLSVYVKKDGLWQKRADGPITASLETPMSVQQTNFRVNSDEKRVVDVKVDGLPWFGFAKGAFYLSVGDPVERDLSKGGNTFYNRKEFLLK